MKKRCLAPSNRHIGAYLLAATAAALSVAPRAAQAQQGDLDALRAQIQAMQARLDKLEAQEKASADAAKASPPVTTASKLPITVSGVLQVQALANLSETTNPQQAAKQINSFKLRRGEVRLTAAVSPRVTATVMFDPSKQLSTASPTNNGINQSTNPLQDLMLTYTTNSTKNWKNCVDVGQFKIPLGYEGDQYPSYAQPTIDRALMYQLRDPFGGGNGDIRETGAQLRGTAGQFDYNLGVFDGLGERQDTLAAGDPKAIIGRVFFRPKQVPGLLLGASFARANTENISQLGTTVGAQASRRLVNLDLVYKRNKLTWQNEFLDGHLQVMGGAGPTPDRPIRSYYSSLGYRLRPSLEGILRYDYFNFDRNLSVDTTVNDITLGMNYYIKGNNAKIQADLVHRAGANGITNGTGSAAFPGSTAFINNRTYLLTQFQVYF